MPADRFRIAREVDISNASDVEGSLLSLINATSDDVVVDCAGLEFIDSTGIAMLMQTKRLLAGQGRDFRIANLTGMPRRSFELVGLIDSFGIDMSEATGD